MVFAGTVILAGLDQMLVGLLSPLAIIEDRVAEKVISSVGILTGG